MKNAEFGKIRSLLWPIYSFELTKLLPMFFMFFFISFNYSILRNIKDVLIITAPGAGAEVIPYLKFWGVVPGAVIFMIFYSKLSNILSKKNLFYCSLIPFVLFFSLFNYVLFPNQDLIHPTALATQLQDAYPGFKFIIAMCSNWSFSLFYIFAELWGSIALSLLFWGFANDTTKVNESKRFYALFGIGANLALEFSGLATCFYTDPRNIGFMVNPMEYTLNGLMQLFLTATLIIVALFWWINTHVLTDPRFFDASQVKTKKSKPKLSIGESFKLLFKSKYLMYIAIIVLAYGVSINLIEVTWKNQLKTLYTSSTELLAFMGTYNRYVGWTTIFMMLFVSSNLLRSFGWKVTALITPIVLLVTGIIFFGVIIFNDSLAPVVNSLGVTPLILAVVVGTIQNVVSKSSKYSLFDPTKEMSYIPLDSEQKTKGKAAIDVVASRLGKAGGSLIQQFLFLIGPLTVVAPYIAIIVIGIIAAWIWAANNLGDEFVQRTGSK